jgi:hypothetical protein
MHCVQYIWNIDIMQARARLLERKMEEDQVRRTLRYLAKVETVEYRAKVPTRSHSVALRRFEAQQRGPNCPLARPCAHARLVQVRLPEVASKQAKQALPHAPSRGLVARTDTLWNKQMR